MLFDWYYLMPFAFTAFLKHFLQRVSHMQIHYKADQSKAELCVQGAWVSPGSVTVLLTGHSAVRLSWAEQSLTLLCTRRGQENLNACTHWSEATSLQGTGDVAT